MEKISVSSEETVNIAGEFIASLKKKENSALIVGLYGELGAGKTTFTQAVAKYLGITETVQSPTFVIEKIYKLEDREFKHLIHIDAYRIEKSDELVSLGWHDMVSNPDNLIFLEWPERVAELLPKDHVKIYFTAVDETRRKITINNQ